MKSTRSKKSGYFGGSPWSRPDWRDKASKLGHRKYRRAINAHPVLGMFERLVQTVGQDDDFVAEDIESVAGGITLTPDMNGNFFYVVPGDSRTLFCAHLDTVAYTERKTDLGIWRGMVGRGQNARYGDYLATHGETILGADDRAGCAILAFMIKRGIPGTYAFFTDEEIGRVGSEKYANSALITKGQYDRAIQFDRGTFDSVITMQSGIVTASDEFADCLADQLTELMGLDRTAPMWPDPGGTYTDTFSLRGLIPECTNIGTGYLNAHSSDECQHLGHLSALADAAVELDWESLPTARIPIRESEMSWRDYTIDDSYLYDDEWPIVTKSSKAPKLSQHDPAQEAENYDDSVEQQARHVVFMLSDRDLVKECNAMGLLEEHVISAMSSNLRSELRVALMAMLLE